MFHWTTQESRVTQWKSVGVHASALLHIIYHWHDVVHVTSQPLLFFQKLLVKMLCDLAYDKALRLRNFCLQQLELAWVLADGFRLKIVVSCKKQELLFHLGWCASKEALLNKCLPFFLKKHLFSLELTVFGFDTLDYEVIVVCYHGNQNIEANDVDQYRTKSVEENDSRLLLIEILHVFTKYLLIFLPKNKTKAVANRKRVIVVDKFAKGEHE